MTVDTATSAGYSVLMKPRHTSRDTAGRYAKTHACDGCGRPVGTDYLTDEEACGSTDGPGFYLCERQRCVSKREALDVNSRRVHYTAMRARNEAVATRAV